MDNVYFKDVANVGDLTLKYEFFEFESEPILFLCTDKNKENLYFCLCSELRYEQRWILVKVDVPELEELIDRKRDIYSIYENSSQIILITADIEGKQNSEVLDFDKIDKLDLPEREVYLECDSNKVLSYLSTVQTKKYRIIIKKEKRQDTKFAKESGILHSNDFYLSATSKIQVKSGNDYHQKDDNRNQNVPDLSSAA